MKEAKPRTLFDKIWDAHIVDRLDGDTCIHYIDRHILDEVHSPQAFEGLRQAGLTLRRPDATIAVPDHNVPTEDRRDGIREENSRAQVAALEANVREFGVPYIPLLDVRQGIVHVVGPELGVSLPGQTMVSGDLHASTHGAQGALAFGIGTSEVGHVIQHALAFWAALPSDPGAPYDKTVTLNADSIAPMATWGTNPEAVVPITGTIPDPDDAADADTRARQRRMLDYMGLVPGTKPTDLKVDVVFIGSCADGRIEDIRAAAAVANGRKLAPGIRGLVVPGSGLVKRQAELEGLDGILTQAGFEWREPGCPMCIAMKSDRPLPGQRCASTSNRNHEGRPCPGGRTDLVSPAMAAAAAVTGRLTDVRDLG